MEKAGEIWFGKLFPVDKGSTVMVIPKEIGELFYYRPIDILEDSSDSIYVLKLIDNLNWRNHPFCILLPKEDTGLKKDFIATLYEVYKLPMTCLFSKWLYRNFIATIYDVYTSPRLIKRLGKISDQYLTKICEKGTVNYLITIFNQRYGYAAKLSAQILGKTKNKQAILTLINAYSVSHYGLKSTIIGALRGIDTTLLEECVLNIDPIIAEEIKKRILSYN